MSKPGPKITNFYKCTFLKFGCGLHLRLKIGRGFTLFKRNTFKCFAAIFFGAFFFHSCAFFFLDGGRHAWPVDYQANMALIFAFCNANRLAQFVVNGKTRHSLTNVISSTKHDRTGDGVMRDLEWYLFCLFSNPHFPQLQNHSFNLQNHKMSQNHTYFRPWSKHFST